MRTVLLRLSGFTLLPLLGLVMPLVLLPVLAQVVGAGGWASTLAGQAIGTFAATVVLWGWNVEGPVLIAKAASPIRRAEVYARSLQTRLLMLLLVTPAAVGIAALNAQAGFAGASMAMALAITMQGLSPSFYGIGAGKPTILAGYDTLPRFVAVLGSVPLLLLTHSVWVYPILQGLTTIVALVGFHRRFAAGTRWLPSRPAETFGEIWRQRKTAGFQLAGNAYAATPTPIANATVPGLAGPLATTDQLYRYGLFAAVALGNAFQGWTLEPGVADPARRHRAAIWAHIGLGLAGLVVLSLAGPPVSQLISAGRAPATTELCLLYGLAFFALSASTPFIRNLLVPAGRDGLVLTATIVSAIAGVGMMLAAGAMGWVAGIAGGMALSEIVLLLILTPPALRLLRQLKPVAGSAEGAFDD